MASKRKRNGSDLASTGESTTTAYSFGKQNWFPYVASEVENARTNVAVFDQTSLVKYIVQGCDALDVLQRLRGNNVDVPEGQAVYTGMFNEKGTYESDLTVVRLSQDSFYLITGTSQAVRDFDRITRNIKNNEEVELTDVTASTSVIGVMGPSAPALLSQLCECDMTLFAFPFGTSQEVEIDKVTADALRITYVGEAGWELHIPTDQALAAYDADVRWG